MVHCSFCAETLKRGTGTMYVKTDGKILYFCSSKCEKNLIKLRRKPRVTPWTAEYQSIKAAAHKEAGG